MQRYLWASLISVALGCGPEAPSDSDSASDSDSTSDTSGSSDTEPGDLEVLRGVYDVQISAVDEGCDAPRFTGRDQVGIQLLDGGFYLPMRFGPLSSGLYVVMIYKFEAIAGESGRYAPATGVVVGEGECGSWQGELGDIELLEEGRISVEATVSWEPAQACLDHENIPSAACTTVLRYDFELVEVCPEECELESLGMGGPNSVKCACP